MLRWTVYAVFVALSVAAGFATKAWLTDGSGSGVGAPGADVGTTASEADARSRIGGPFSLVDHHGQTVADREFRGRVLLVFFGYTSCPDACPTALQNVSDALDLLGPAAAQVQPLFISVDPERDTPETMAAFVGHFHPGIIGLTGSLVQVRKAARVYRVRFAKVPIEGAAAGEYLMDHSAVIYVIERDGQFFQHIPYETEPEVIARRISRLIGKNPVSGRQAVVAGSRDGD